jgi:predicted enzyme related to lactoylglutathione lyase
MEMERYGVGVPAWVDIGVPDPQIAADFYGALFGWEVPEGPAEAGGYRFATVGRHRVAGIGVQRGVGPPAWATYIATDDADATSAAVEAAGGRIVLPPIDVLDVGRMAVFTDPVGAVLSLWQAVSHPGAELVNEPGTWSWSELLTTDPEASKAFYGEVLGWTAVTHGAATTGEYTEWQVDGRSVAGMMRMPPTTSTQQLPHWAVYFAVADTDTALARIPDLGGRVVVPATDIEPGRFATVSDPAGGVFNVIALAPERTRS